MVLLLILAAVVLLGGFIGHRKGMKVDGGKHAGVYTLAGAGIALAVAIVGFFLLVALFFAMMPVC